MGDEAMPAPFGGEGEEASHDGGLLRVDLPDDVRAAPLGVGDDDVVVAVHGAAGDVAALGFSLQCIDLLAPEPVGVGNQQHLERRPWLQRIEQRDEAGPLGELRARDPIVDVDMLVGGEAMRGGVGARLVELARGALLVGGDVVLVGGLPRVDGSDHGTIGPPSRPYHLVG
jgi:hypothetical protein